MAMARAFTSTSSGTDGRHIHLVQPHHVDGFAQSFYLPRAHVHSFVLAQ